jgi:outer membrane protease
MKRNFFLLLVFLYLFFAMPLCAQIFNLENHSFSMQIESGVLYGTAYEILYENSHSADYLSELQWNIKPLWFVGAFFEYAPKDPLANNALFFNADIKIGIPSKAGVMEDRDWMDRSKPNVLTHFSSHDNKTTEAFIMNNATGFSIPLMGDFLAKVSLDFMLMHYQFEAWDGYTQYGTNTTRPPYNPWNPNFKKVDFNGLGLDYYQLWIILKPTFGIEWYRDKFVFKSAFSFNTDVFCYTVDNHLVRDPPFTLTGILQNGLFLEAKGSFFYKLSKNFSVGISIAYTSIEGTRGDVTLEEKYGYRTITTESPNCEGAGYQAFTGEFMIKITF